MHWIQDYQLFLFDFDGLLVNTEELHYLAYKRMMTDNGLNLEWDFNRYCQIAHYEHDGIKKQIFADYPSLKDKAPSWEVLYEQKKQSVIDLINEGAVHMMPGAEKLLAELEQKGIKRAVVTHSSEALVDPIRRQNPILDTIPAWITRHEYTHPKPHPECYLKAIEKLAVAGDRVIGFEDTPRGLKALMQTEAQPILICQVKYPEIPLFIKNGAFHYSSLEAIPDKELVL